MRNLVVALISVIAVQAVYLTTTGIASGLYASNPATGVTRECGYAYGSLTFGIPSKS